MSYIAETLGNLLQQTAFFNLTWGNYVMIAVACGFLYLAIAKEFEPLLLVPISFGMDVRVLREDNTEVELGENIDYGDVDIRSILEGDSRRFNNNNDESFGDHGFSKQEFDGEELVDVSEDDDYDDDESVDADEDMGYDE